MWFAPNGSRTLLKHCSLGRNADAALQYRAFAIVRRYFLRRTFLVAINLF